MKPQAHENMLSQAANRESEACNAKEVWTRAPVESAGKVVARCDRVIVSSGQATEKAAVGWARQPANRNAQGSEQIDNRGKAASSSKSSDAKQRSRKYSNQQTSRKNQAKFNRKARRIRSEKPHVSVMTQVVCDAPRTNDEIATIGEKLGRGSTARPLRGLRSER